MVVEVTAVLTFFVAAFLALITIVNPFSTTSVFISITRGDSMERKREMARRACVVSAVVLIVFSLIGSFILSFFSITLDAFRIAGGVLVAGVGYRMVRSVREHLHTDKEKKEAVQKDDISIIPLAIPMTAGPGAMTTALVLMGETNTLFDIIAIMVAIVAVCFTAYLILSRSDTISRYLGETGRKVTDRILGLIVLVVGVQFIINGIAGVVQSWGLA